MKCPKTWDDLAPYLDLDLLDKQIQLYSGYPLEAMYSFTTQETPLYRENVPVPGYSIVLWRTVSFTLANKSSDEESALFRYIITMDRSGDYHSWTVSEENARKSLGNEIEKRRPPSAPQYTPEYTGQNFVWPDLDQPAQPPATNYIPSANGPDINKPDMVKVNEHSPGAHVSSAVLQYGMPYWGKALFILATLAAVTLVFIRIFKPRGKDEG